MNNGVKVCCGKCYPPGERAYPDEVTLDNVIEGLVALQDHVEGFREVIEKLKEQEGNTTIRLK